MLGDAGAGTPGSDAYSTHAAHGGQHQRCWPHPLRDTRDPCAAHPDAAALERQLVALGAPHRAPDSAAPRATLGQRVARSLDGLLTFVADPAVPPDNTPAARSLRPLVIARKVSGGARSPEDPRVRMARASLFATRHARGRDPGAACHQLLLAPAR